MKNSTKPSILFIGPYPPPYGGVSTVIKNLMEQKIFTENYEIFLYRTGKNKETTHWLFQILKDIVQIIRYFLTLRFKNIDVFYVHTSSYWSFLRNIPFLCISKYLSNGVTILHIHGGEFNEFFDKSSPLVKKIVKKGLTSVNCIVVTAPSWVNVIKKIIGNDISIFPIPNGYDEKKFFPSSLENARQNLHLPLDKKIIITVGSIEYHKGHRILIESMKKMAQTRDNVMVSIIGKGSLIEELQQLINKYHLKDKIMFVGGNKTPEEVSVWVNASDVFVLPSLKEGNPTVMFECLACGKPFVGTSVGGIPDVITSPEYGLLCEPGNVTDLTDKLLIALEKDWDHEKIIQYAAKFTWQKIAGEVNDIVKKFLRNNQKEYRSEITGI